jgi:CubicO group peptidase (beta-lactamase class C family)
LVDLAFAVSNEDLRKSSTSFASSVITPFPRPNEWGGVCSSTVALFVGGIKSRQGAIRAERWPNEAGSGGEVLERANELMVEAMNEHTTPGVGVGIVDGSGTVYAKGFGLADVERERPVTRETVFRIGSITKTTTAIGLMRLWERGEFRLDDPINDYLRGYRIEHPDPAAPPVTFRHMLTHTSGIGELRKVTDLFRPIIGLGAKPDGPAPSTEEYYAGGLRPRVYPGTKWAYANHAFNVLGQLIADISGEQFD